MFLSISHRRQLLSLVCFTGLTAVGALHAAPTTDTATAPPQADAFTQMLLALDVNQQQLDRTALVLKSRSGELLLAEEDLKAARVKIPPGPPTLFQGANYYRLTALPSISVRLDEARQTLTLELKPEAFVGTSTALDNGNSPVPQMPAPGMFFNYQVDAAHSRDGSVFSGSLETGFFSALGHAISTFALISDGDTRRAIRLDSTLTMDQPDKVASLRLGDAISRPAAGWGNALRFGGIQYATNFGVRPGLITLPLQTFSAQAALPSTVDIFVNSVFVARREVQPGPFAITDLPVISGRGNVSMVVRDVTGREQMINQPFYSSPSLLRQGVADFSFEAGALRRNYGVASQDYGPMFGSGTYRLGLSDAITAEAHAQARAGGRAVAGFSLMSVLSSLGTLSAGAAASSGDAGKGALWSVGFDRQSSLFSVDASTQLADARFQQPGDDGSVARARRLTTLNLGLPIRNGSLGAFYLRQETPGQAPAALANLSYSMGLGRYGVFNAAGFKALRGTAANSLSVSWVMPLGSNTSISASHTISRDGASQSALQAQRSLTPESGYGYRLQLGQHVAQQAALSLQNRVGDYSLEAASFAGSSGVRTSMSGGVAILPGAAFATRRISDSFGVVQVPGMENVRIYVDNQLSGHTDSTGNALLPHLRAYENNVVRVEAGDLDMDAAIATLELKAVPFARSGTVITFPIRHSQGAMMTLVADDGTALPAGTVVVVEGQAEPFPVGIDGTVYLTGLATINDLRATFAGKACRATLPFKKTPDPLPNLGTFVCTAEKP